MAEENPGLLFSPRWRRMTLRLTLLVALIEGGYLLLVTYGKALLAVPVAGPLNVGLLLGIVATVAGWLIACVYVVWANRAERRQAAPR